MNATDLSVSFLPERPLDIPASWDKLETVDTATLVACTTGHDGKQTLSEMVTVRWRRSRHGDGASPVSCAVFVTAPGNYRTGYGRAGGYGYCKRSQAFAVALESAGVKLSKDVGGRGMSVVREALLAIGKAIVGEVPMAVVEG